MQLRRFIAAVSAGLACAAGLLGAAPPNPPKKKSPRPKATVSPRRAKGKPAAKTAARRPRKATVTAARTVRPAWHPGQTAPTPERYREIQEALARKGYLHGESSGVWNQDSADALRRFQQDQNLEASGKLDSLSIIALGLGPKY